MTLLIGLIFAISPLLLLFGMLAMVVGFRDACAIALVAGCLTVSVWFGLHLIGGAI